MSAQRDFGLCLLRVIACYLVIQVHTSLKAEDFLLSTPNTSLLLEANKDKSLHLQYYGTRIESSSEGYNSGTALWQLAYPSFGIETWTEISHQEKKSVMLYYFPSASIPFRPGKYYLSHLHGAWATETQLSEEELLPGVKIIKNKDGVRNAQTDNPSLMLSVGQEPSENSGAVFGATLIWSGNYELKIDTDHYRRSRLFAGINPDASQYTLMPGEIFQTPPMAMTYSIEGKGGVSRNFHR